ncbi:response regulator receiver protein [Methanoregula boonei 6A8]|jgi:DNA-binding response OmpR family regulator|uniref:Response regulator receiver protein n=1 Tax=Methanoregula boonei (strain DSM 21154 / JCM 14090 / 6A8) TaxID=456442 RepID=A7I9B9_METB6|nr:response regulator [Methanoregula boonei]ABS56330.1 response regulator receiver protein [Methanoregula boonei 6A8]
MDKIAVIDDDPSIVEVFSQTLTFFGYDTCTFTDPAVALASLPCEDPAPSLILLDLMMSPITGLQFLEEQKKSTSINGIPVIIVSAWDLPPEDRQRFGGVIADVIRKPVHPRDLAGCIQTALDREKTGSADQQ